MDVKRVSEVIAMNKEGKKPASLLEDVEPEGEEAAATLNSDLEELDKKYQRKKKKKHRGKNRNRGHKRNS